MIPANIHAPRTGVEFPKPFKVLSDRQIVTLSKISQFLGDDRSNLLSCWGKFFALIKANVGFVNAYSYSQGKSTNKMKEIVVIFEKDKKVIKENTKAKAMLEDTLRKPIFLESVEMDLLPGGRKDTAGENGIEMGQTVQEGERAVGEPDNDGDDSFFARFLKGFLGESLYIF